MSNEHLARIFWSDEQERRGLPAFTRTTDPAWLGPSEDAWSLVCRFHASPREQGSPSIAKVSFLLEEAPHSRLLPGVKLRIFERSTQQLATVEIID
jgi:hypothetical protein